MTVTKLGGEQISSNSLRMFPMAVARSSSSGVTIHYVLPVLWMTSRFHIMTPLRISCIPKRRYKHISQDSSQILLSDKDQQVISLMSYAPG